MNHLLQVYSSLAARMPGLIAWISKVDLHRRHDRRFHIS